MERRGATLVELEMIHGYPWATVEMAGVERTFHAFDLTFRVDRLPRVGDLVQVNGNPRERTKGKWYRRQGPSGYCPTCEKPQGGRHQASCETYPGRPRVTIAHVS